MPPAVLTRWGRTEIRRGESRRDGWGGIVSLSRTAHVELQSSYCFVLVRLLCLRVTYQFVLLCFLHCYRGRRLGCLAHTLFLRICGL